MIAEQAKHLDAEIQLEFARPQDQLMRAISTALPFERIKEIVESAPAPRRPNRVRPMPVADESAAWSEIEKTALTFAELEELFEDQRPEQ